jgi:hypothetical protein
MDIRADRYFMPNIGTLKIIPGYRVVVGAARK